jgi:hypothetical protein
LAATLTGALAATAEPRKVEVMAAILYKCVVDAISRMIGATRRARHKTNGDSELDRSTNGSTGFLIGRNIRYIRLR